MDDAENTIYTLEKGVVFFPKKRCLISQDGIHVTLTENSYRLLLKLLSGETNKQNIIEDVWAEQGGAVSESSYYGQLYLLRRSFDEIGLPHTLIKTLPRKGVKYIGQSVKGTCVLTDDSTYGNIPIPQADFTYPQLSTDRIEVKKNEDTEKLSTPIKTEWYHSKSWTTFVLVLSIIAVCWLVSLTLAIVLYWKG